MNTTNAGTEFCIGAAGPFSRFIQSPYITLLIYLPLGLFGRLITLWAIHQECKTEKVYLYQVFVLVIEAMENVVYTSSVVIRSSTGEMGNAGIDWFRKCYWCMWYAAHVMVVLNNVFMSFANLLTLAMCIDRIYALIKPIKHKTLKQARIQWSTFIVGILISILTSIVYAFGDWVFPDQTGGYTVITNPPLSNVAFKIFFLGHVIFKGSLIILLVASNIGLCHAYRTAMARRAALKRLGQNESTSWKTLFKMSACQSVYNTFSEICRLSFVLVLGIGYFDLYLMRCLLGPTCTILQEIFDVLSFYVTMVVSKRFRMMVVARLKVLSCNSVVVSINGQR